MLYALGPLLFEVAPFNTHETEREAEMDFAAKDVLGRRRIHEKVGEGEEQFTMHGKLFPQKLGGLDELSLANAIRSSGAPQMLVRGDGTPLGWFLLRKVRERSSYLDTRGIGKMIDVDLELLRDDPPSPEGFVEVLFSLFG